MDTTSPHNLTKKERKEQKKQEKMEAEQQKQKQDSFKQYSGWVLGIAVLIGLGFFLKYAFTPPAPGTIPELQSINQTDQVKGASQSATLLIEYSDFQCPACRTYYPTVEQLIAEKGDQFAFVYRHFPLAQHDNAEEAARAAEAAGKQGKFWDMYKLLFDRQDAWAEEKNPDEVFLSYAKELQLVSEQFSTDYTSQEITDKVNNDMTSGVRVGVNSTPTFYLNGTKIQPGSLEDFKKLIDEANASQNE